MAEPVSALRVLSVAHPAVSRAAGRLRYEKLAEDPSLALRLVVPARWFEFGRWLEAEPETGKLDVATLPIWFPRAGPARWYLHCYPKLGQIGRAFRPDVLHLWEEPWSLVALQVARLARRLGAALVLEVDQNILKRLPPPFENIRRHVLANTDLILSRSREATRVVRQCGFSGPTLPIGYGVDTARFHPAERPPPGPALRLGYVGRLVAEKGIDDVIDALALARADIRFAILGAGPHEPALRERVQTMGLGPRVTFQPWDDPAGVARFMQAQHALILPTRTTPTVREQFGRVIIEAQACGTPVIGSSSGAIPSVIGDGGWVFPERDVAALAQLLDRLAAAPAERDQRAAAGLLNVARRFTYATVTDTLLRGWRDAAQAHGTPAACPPRPGALVRSAAE